jgi:uroporphyrin-3 C-methyltransferase
MLNTDKLALDNNAASSNQSGWKRGLQTSWQALQKIVVVRYHESGALPFMTPDQQLFLYQNVHAMISQSMWALLHGQTIIYQKSLQQTINWVKEYFLLDSPVTQAVLNELNELQKIDIHPATPEISGSLQAFTAMKGNE